MRIGGRVERMNERTVTQSPPTRRRGETTRLAILEAAFHEFSEQGLSGARVDAIAERCSANARMIYYYFGSKAGLYAAVLENAYAAMREAESGLLLDALEPVTAIEMLCGFIFDYHEAHPGYSRLVCIENIHRGEHLTASPMAKAQNRPILTTLDDILRRGAASGVFRKDATPWEVHILMTAFPFFRVANRHTLQAIFERNTLDARTRRRHRQMAVKALLGFLQPE